MKGKVAANPGKTQGGEGERARDAARFPGIQLFDERVSWKAPSLFDNRVVLDRWKGFCGMGEAAGILERDDIRELLHPVKAFAKFGAGAELLTCIPEALQ